MRISSVELTNFKGITGTFQLSERTLLTGQNGSGKSAILQGIAFVATGATVIGRTNEAAATMFRGGEGCVTLNLDDGSSLGRGVLKSDGYSQVIYVNGRAMPKLKGEAAILSKLGDFAPQFDLRSFLGLKAEARRTFVLDLLSASMPATPATEFWAGLALEGVAAQKFQMDLLKRASKPITADVLSETLEWLGDRVNESKRELDVQEKTARELQVRNADITVVTVPHKIREVILALEASIAEIHGQIGEHRGQAEAWKRTCDRVAWLRTQLIEPSKLEDNGLVSSRLRAIEDQAADFEKQADHLEAAEVTAHDLPAMAERLKAAKEEAARLSNEENRLALEYINAGPMVLKCGMEFDDLRRRIVEAEASPWMEARRLYDTAYSETDEEYATEWDKLGYFISDQCAKAHPGGLAEAEVALKDAERLRDEAKSAHETAVEACKAATIERDRVDAEHTALLTSLNDARLRVQSLKNQAQTARLEADNIRKGAEAAAGQRAAWEAELSTLEASMATAPPSSMDDLDIVLDAKQAELVTAKSDLATALEAEAMAASSVKANARAEEARAEHDGYKAVREAVREERDRRIGDMLQLILGPLRAYLAGAFHVDGPVVEPYCDLVTESGRPAFQIGWKLNGDGQRVPVEAMSGGEAALFGCGLVYALVSLSRSPIKLLIIDGGELDSHRLADVARAIAGLDGYDQAVIATHLPFGGAKDWTVLRMSERPEAEPITGVLQEAIQ